MRYIQIICTIVLSAVPVLGQDVSLDTLVTQLKTADQYTVSDQAFRRLRQRIRSSDTSTVNQTQTTLTQELDLATDPRSIRSIGRVLCAAPSDQFFAVAIAKLSDNGQPRIREAACDVIASIGSEMQSINPQLVDSALSQLHYILRDESAPASLVDSAVLAMSSLGSKGMDGLLKSKSSAGPIKARSGVYYSALARTGDLRALPFLRDALTDATLRQGLQIQAAHAIGQLAAQARSQRTAVISVEVDSCIRVLTQILEKTDSDQLYGVTLIALGKLAGVEPNGHLHQTILQNLYSSSKVRQVSALEALYAAECNLVDASLVEVLRQLATSEDQEISAVSNAVLGKCGLDEVHQ